MPVHVLVHVRLRHYCLLLRHPAKLYWRTGLSFCERYANPCVEVRLAATFQDLDSKSADPQSETGKKIHQRGIITPMFPSLVGAKFLKFAFETFRSQEQVALGRSNTR